MLKAASNREIVGSASVDYLMYSGWITMGYYWLRIAEAAAKGIKSNPNDADFYRSKLQTAEFFFNRHLPRTTTHAKTMLKDPKDMLQLNEEHFL